MLLLRADHFRSALVICQNAYICASLQSRSEYRYILRSILISQASELLLTSNMNIYYLCYIHNALSMLENQVVQLGTSYTFYWYISAGYALLQSTINPDQSMLESNQAVERLARLFYRALASQEDIEHAKENILALSRVTVSISPLWRGAV